MTSSNLTTPASWRNTSNKRYGRSGTDDWRRNAQANHHCGGSTYPRTNNSILSGVTRTAHRTPVKPQSRPGWRRGIHPTGWCKTVKPEWSQRNMSPLWYRWTFLCRCSYPPIKDSRERFLSRLIQLLHTALGFERLDEQSEYNEIVQLVLDCTAYDPDESHTHDTAWLALESHAREYCYELHRLRYAAVKELRGSQPCRSRPLLRTT